MKKGFVNLILLLGVAAAFALGAFAYQKAAKNDPKLGATIQTQLSDTIGTFRTNVNQSFTNLDTNVATITSTLATYGNIVTENIPLRQSSGGLGTSTLPSANQFLSANNSSATWKTFIFGGGILSTTTATSVQINTTGIDATANYNWTGTNTYSSGTQAFNSTTTFNSSTVVNGALTIPTSTLQNGSNLFGTIAANMKLLASSTISGSPASILSVNVPTSSYLHVVAEAPSGNGAVVISLQFNANSSSLYVYRYVQNMIASAPTNVTGTTSFIFPFAFSSGFFVNADVSVQQGINTGGTWSYTDIPNASTSLPNTWNGFGAYTSSTAISSVRLNAGGGTMPTGTNLYVFGY